MPHDPWFTDVQVRAAAAEFVRTVKNVFEITDDLDCIAINGEIDVLEGMRAALSAIPDPRAAANLTAPPSDDDALW